MCTAANILPPSIRYRVGRRVELVYFRIISSCSGGFWGAAVQWQHHLVQSKLSPGSFLRTSRYSLHYTTSNQSVLQLYNSHANVWFKILCVENYLSYAYWWIWVYCVTGSFGSLGICTRAKILCMPASQRVKVTCRAHDTAASCYEHMRELQRQTLSMGAIDAFAWIFSSVWIFNVILISGSSEHLRFLEGIGYSQRKFVSIRGSFLPQQSQEESVTWTSSSRWGYKWFFNIVKDRCKQLFKVWKNM